MGTIKLVSTSYEVDYLSSDQNLELSEIISYNVQIPNIEDNRDFTMTAAVELYEGAVKYFTGYVRTRKIDKGIIYLEVCSLAVKLYDTYVRWHTMAEKGLIYEMGAGAGGGSNLTIMATLPADLIVADILGSVFAEDDQAQYWETLNSGSGSYVLSISDDAAEKQTGENSLKCVVAAGAYEECWIRAYFPTPIDISMMKRMKLLVYGANSGKYHQVWLLNILAGKYAAWRIKDDFTGWALKTLDLENPEEELDWTGTDFQLIWVIFATSGAFPLAVNYACQATGTWRFDRIWFEENFTISECPTTIISVKFEDVTKMTALLTVAKTLGKDLWFVDYDVHIGTKGTGVGALTVYSVLHREETDDFSNRVIARAVDSGGKAIEAVAEDTDSIEEYHGAFEKVVIANEAFDLATLQLVANAVLAEVKQVVQASLSIPTVLLGTIKEGDIITLNDVSNELVGDFQIVKISSQIAFSIVEISSKISKTGRTLTNVIDIALASASVMNYRITRSHTYSVDTEGRGDFKKVQDALDKIS